MRPEFALLLTKRSFRRRFRFAGAPRNRLLAIGLVLVVLASLSETGAWALPSGYVGSANRPQNDGYWLVTAQGTVRQFGAAPFLGDMADEQLNKPIVGMASTSSGAGYWLVASDGGIFSFGDAQFYGSTGSIKLNKPIVGMSATPSGAGYWLVASDGGIFSFGDAQFYGSTGSIDLSEPIVGMSTTPDGRGYWLAGADGGIFSFGDAEFYGSALHSGRSGTIAIVATSDGGYSVVHADGTYDYRPAPASVDTPPVLPPTIVPPAVTADEPTTEPTEPPSTTTTTTTPPSTTTTSTTTPLTSTTTTTAPNGNGWTQIFYDGFDTSANEGSFLSTYGSKWGAYAAGWLDTSKKGQYNPNVISVNNGLMNMRLHTNSAGKPQVAAPYPKINGAASTAQLYGRYEVRFRADAVDGYKTAWLLWPKSEVWPRDGEIDFPEGDLTGTIGAFMHRQQGTSGSDQDHFGSSARYPDWHTAILEWTPTKINFILDGKLLGSSTSRIPNTPMRWVLQTETELNSSYPAASAVANVQIDYVKVWKYAP